MKKTPSKAVKKSTAKKKAAKKTIAKTTVASKTKAAASDTKKKAAKNATTARKRAAPKRPQGTAEQRAHETKRIACMLAEADGLACDPEHYWLAAESRLGRG